MEKSFYDNEVSFTDPMTTFTGIEKYQSNVDMLAGRTTLGSLLFKDASIALHSITKPSKTKLISRWTLRVTVKVLPWSPTARFTGVSIYTLNSSGKVTKQDDYWDSVNLKEGDYSPVSLVEGVTDFLSQLKREAGAQTAAPELPYELLRRANRYEVRRYPSYLGAETVYNQRPEGYDRLGSYAGGSNTQSSRLPFFTPTLMTVRDTSEKRVKVMTWPMVYQSPGVPLASVTSLPDPTIRRVTLLEKPSVVVAVTRFEIPATEPVVRGFTAQLMKDVESDGLVVNSRAREGQCIVGQFDALFSLNKRRNEVWVELDDHPWV
eukprot:CAMPEP_0182417576 /NCGR_PEP_ID=MMETSP1167-20130531/2041_1 /TAXON_ID=2988 /ORGANISM="Mallomonas Sp, Strain CCMP3275" /LENGTH=319 /DNA_ID=CAMNT_0024591241 /DNA_START=190 /DNA_END=1149 /DNA_ORIENTATION=+